MHVPDATRGWQQRSDGDGATSQYMTVAFFWESIESNMGWMLCPWGCAKTCSVFDLERPYLWKPAFCRENVFLLTPPKSRNGSQSVLTSERMIQNPLLPNNFPQTYCIIHLEWQRKWMMLFLVSWASHTEFKSSLEPLNRRTAPLKRTFSFNFHIYIIFWKLYSSFTVCWNCLHVQWPGDSLAGYRGLAFTCN